MSRPVQVQLIAGGLINQALLVVPIIYLSGVYMDIAAGVLGEKVAWPLIGFMSAYPSDVRNGYLLFAAAVLTVVFVSSGPFAGFMGASFGKAAMGVRYVDDQGQPTGFGRFLMRGFAMASIVAVILFPGPILGFVFGPDIDNLSLASLFLGTLFAIWALIGMPPSQLSPINRLLGMRPVLRSGIEET